MGGGTCMPIEKRDPEFGTRFILPLVVIFAVAALCGLVAMGYSQDHKGWAGIWPFCLVVGLMLIAIFALHHRVLRRYRCPQCGSRIPFYREDSTRVEEYRYYCKDCDVIWNTGLRQGES